mmetsp:Transcript_35351/g.114446  ORF Transcript_35351/g.114446 Transcript_35351/m.114446 type:complete len:257 (+) Transcript_35351:1562-2332(+)
MVHRWSGSSGTGFRCCAGIFKGTGPLSAGGPPAAAGPAADTGAGSGAVVVGAAAAAAALQLGRWLLVQPTGACPEALAGRGAAHGLHGLALQRAGRHEQGFGSVGFCGRPAPLRRGGRARHLGLRRRCSVVRGRARGTGGGELAAARFSLQEPVGGGARGHRPSSLPRIGSAAAHCVNPGLAFLQAPDDVGDDDHHCRHRHRRRCRRRHPRVRHADRRCGGRRRQLAADISHFVPTPPCALRTTLAGECGLLVFSR